ncbi:o-succinylbenzoate synthase [Heyndrickxia shackletonii]|uniref:o-succinylbenzoate synthase n=1 Tax=Heyndrickxia shackletonii TaxID=157838 RepID=UPI000AEBB5E6|nr:o-succinylbenzoate synthase [Heyndrickxia shackletonii]
MIMKPIQPKKITLRKLQMKLKQPFTTSFGTQTEKEFCILEVEDKNGNIGWGESGALTFPGYNEETTITNQHILEDFLIPSILGNSYDHPDQFNQQISYIRRNRMAKSTVETAIWDLYAKNNGVPLYKVLGGEKKDIKVGVSIGIKDSIKELLETIEEKMDKGFHKIKVKIKPGKDVEVIREIRKVFPDIPLMADANSAYTLKDIDLLKQLDQFNLLMIEQPLEHDDIIHHSKLQKQIETPICLDESICSYEDAKNAIELGSCKIINIKIGRVGGHSESIKIHNLCKEHNIPVWCGGMLEAGIGRAHNIAITSLSQFLIPGDTGPSQQYWHEDIIQPEVEVKNGIVQLPSGNGIGYTVDKEKVKKYTVYEKQFTVS